MKERAKARTKNKLPPFTHLLNEEMDSKAYLELSGTAAKALMWFKRIDGKLKGKDRHGYNGIFDFTYTEAVKYGFAKKTFSRAIDELNEKGFITIVKVGGMRGVGRSNSKYSLSTGWRLYGRGLKVKLRIPTEPDPDGHWG